jgi:hypothetical protein
MFSVAMIGIFEGSEGKISYGLQESTGEKVIIACHSSRITEENEQTPVRIFRICCASLFHILYIY